MGKALPHAQHEGLQIQDDTQAEASVGRVLTSVE